LPFGIDKSSPRTIRPVFILPKIHIQSGSEWPS